MLCSGGGCDNAIAARCWVAWGKFRKLLPVLTSRHLSPRIHGKVTRLAFAWLCSMVAKCEDQRNPSCRGSIEMTMPWSIGSVASKTETRYPQLHYNRALVILHWTFAVRDLDDMAMYNGPRPVSKLSQIFSFPALERKIGPEDMVWMCEDWCQLGWPSWQRCMESQCST